MIALAAGGALETVIDGETGALVAGDSAEAFADGIRRAIDGRLDPAAIRQHAERFSKDAFKTAFAAAVSESVTRS